MKVFIDTNIFLDFYRSNIDKIKILEELKAHMSFIVMPEQVYNEYKRNRFNILNELIMNCNNMKINGSFSCSIIKDWDEYKKLEEAKNEWNSMKLSLVKKIEEMKSDVSKDIVFSTFSQIYGSSEVIKYRNTQEIIENARVRQLLGNPPGSNKITIGDEVIWEAILTNAKDDLIIVSRDLTYTSNESLLKEEFNMRTNKNILKITNKISDALEVLGNAPNKVIESLEDEQLDELDHLKNVLIKITAPMAMADMNKVYIDFCYRCGTLLHESDSRCPKCGVWLCD